MTAASASHVPPRHVPVAPVMRRPSPVNPAAGAWAVVGLGAHGNAMRTELGRAGIATLGYDLAAGPDESEETIRWGRRVIAIEEIEDIDALAVTSRDVMTGEITTEYLAGVVLSVGGYDGWDFIDPDTLNVCDGHPVLAHRMFTPRHPAVVVSGPDVTAGLDRQAEVVAAYAGALRTSPRSALAFHRRVCARLLPGYPRVVTDPVAGQDYESVLAYDLQSLIP